MDGKLPMSCKTIFIIRFKIDELTHVVKHIHIRIFGNVFAKNYHDYSVEITPFTMSVQMHGWKHKSDSSELDQWHLAFDTRKQ